MNAAAQRALLVLTKTYLLIRTIYCVNPFWLSFFLIIYPWQVRHVASTHCPNLNSKYIPMPIYHMFEVAVFLDTIFLQKWKGTIWSCHWPRNIWPVPCHATLCIQDRLKPYTLHTWDIMFWPVKCGSLVMVICWTNMLISTFYASAPPCTWQERFENMLHSEICGQSLQNIKLGRAFLYKLLTWQLYLYNQW